MGLLDSGGFREVLSKALPAGTWAIAATANLTSVEGSFGGQEFLVRDASCQLRNGGAVIGGTTDRRVLPENERVKRSLSMNGGALIPAGGGVVSLWCNSQNGSNETVDQAQIMILQVGTFF